MIQRDYLMRMVQDFVKMLLALLEFKKVGNWKEVEANLDRAAQILFQKKRTDLEGLDDEALKRVLLQSGATHEYRLRAQVLTRLLAESAELASAQGDIERGRSLNLKALNLLLDVLLRCEDVERLDFTPSVEGVVDALGETPLPSATVLGLMNHYENQGEFAKAEDQLYLICESGQMGAGVQGLGESFYQRLLDQPDWLLLEGGLPRDEVEAGLAEFRERCREGFGA